MPAVTRAIAILRLLGDAAKPLGMKAIADALDLVPSTASQPGLKTRFKAITWDQAPAFEVWKSDVEQARRRGWAVDRDHFMAGITVVAVPLLRPDGRLTHTLAAAGLSSQLTASVVNDLVAHLRDETAQLNELLLLKA